MNRVPFLPYLAFYFQRAIFSIHPQGNVNNDNNNAKKSTREIATRVINASLDATPPLPLTGRIKRESI